MILAGTGHRPIKLVPSQESRIAYSPGVRLKLIKLIEPVLIKLKPSEVISGMALGFDQALAQAAINLKIPFRAAIPFPNQEKVWNSRDQAYYYELLSQAQNQVIVSPPPYSNQKLILRNKYMIDECTEVLALYDGVPAGGTFRAIEYAKSNSKPITNLWETWILLAPS